MKGGADQLCSLSSVLLLSVPEAVSSNNEGRSRSAVQSILCVAPLCPEAVSSHIKAKSLSAVQSNLYVAPLCPRGSLVPYKSEEHQFCEALLKERTVLAGDVSRYGGTC